MKSRSVKLWLGKIAMSNIKLPRTSYVKKPYRATIKNGANAGKSVIRHRKAEHGIEFYKHDASPKQAQFGIHYRKGTVRTRPMNANDIQAFNDSDVANDNPYAHEATSLYVSAISQATSEVATRIVSKLDVEYQRKHQSNPSNAEDQNQQDPQNYQNQSDNQTSDDNDNNPFDNQ